MAVAAHFDTPQSQPGKTRAQRRRLLLETAGESAAGELGAVLLHNVSATGLLLETEVALSADETIEVDLPEAGLQTARVVWSDGSFHGCRFDQPISTAALSAIELRAVAPAPLALPGDGEETFSARLHRLRKERGLTLAAIADQLGVSKPTVWAWEQGRAKPTAGHMTALAEMFALDQAELAGSSGSAQLRAVIGQARQQIADVMQIDITKVRIMLEL
ncbi:MAG: helix-turn-helix domain-containing protein [Novosphingobium sp.]